MHVDLDFLTSIVQEIKIKLWFEVDDIKVDDVVEEKQSLVCRWQGYFAIITLPSFFSGTLYMRISADVALNYVWNSIMKLLGKKLGQTK